MKPPSFGFRIKPHFLALRQCLSLKLYMKLTGASSRAQGFFSFFALVRVDTEPSSSMGSGLCDSNRRGCQLAGVSHYLLTAHCGTVEWAPELRRKTSVAGQAGRPPLLGQ